MMYTPLIRDYVVRSAHFLRRCVYIDCAAHLYAYEQHGCTTYTLAAARIQFTRKHNHQKRECSCALAGPAEGLS